MKNKVRNRFFSKLISKLNLKKFEENTDNTRSSIDDRGSERVKPQDSGVVLTEKRLLYLISAAWRIVESC